MPEEMDDHPGRSGLEGFLEHGRRLVDASADIPREALRFLGRHRLVRRGPPLGSAPGAMAVSSDSPAPSMRVSVYGPDDCSEQFVEDVDSLPRLLDAPGRVAWLEVEGLGESAVLERIGRALGIPPLAMADVVHVPQRPKVELHEGRMLVVMQMARMVAGQVELEQVSLVLGPGWVVTFQDRPGDVFDPVRKRIRSPGARVRQLGADYLTYALVDAVVDGFFPVVEAIGGVIDALEEDVIERASRTSLARIHGLRRTLLTLHRVQWCQRDALSTLLRDEELPLGDAMRPYLRDAHDHAFQTLDAIETYRDMAVGLMDLQLSSASHRLNEVMKTLTVVATVFIPLTFLVGVYGMNFDYMPELRWRWGYPATWLAMLAIGGGLVAWFRARGWLGGSEAERGP